MFWSNACFNWASVCAFNSSVNFFPIFCVFKDVQSYENQDNYQHDYHCPQWGEAQAGPVVNVEMEFSMTHPRTDLASYRVGKNWCTGSRSMSALGQKRTWPAYSITSSARESSEGGTVRPSAFAVLRLIASSYLVGACTGMSAGFSPLRMRST